MSELNPRVLKKLAEWRHKPLAFAQECMHFNPSDQQAELISSITMSKFVTVRSGHGIGKDACVGGVIIPWFLVTRPQSKVVCTAPTARQLSDILWSEIAKWLMNSAISEEFVIQKDKIYQKDYPKTWWCRAVSASAKATKEEQAETLAGFHGDHLLIVVDEASGVVDPVFIPLEGALTQEDNMCILIGNMTKNAGYFYDTHFHPTISVKWKKFHFDSRKSSNVKQSWCQEMEDKYGVNSNVFRIRVAGEPPLEDDKNFISLTWAEQCIGNEITTGEDEPLYLGVDVGRYGDDPSVILPRTGMIIQSWETFSGMNTITLASHVLECYTDMSAEGVAIDEIGVGAGVVDWLYKHNLRGCFGVNVATSSSDIKKYDRLRDELWWRVRENCISARYSFPTEKLHGDILSLGQQLANELASLTYDFNAQGGYKVESKKKARLRGIKSPNIADALCLTEYFSNIATQVWPKKARNEAKKKQDRWRENQSSSSSGGLSWMAV